MDCDWLCLTQSASMHKSGMVNMTDRIKTEEDSLNMLLYFKAMLTHSGFCQDLGVTHIPGLTNIIKH